jgi:hypothetical protein
MWNRDSESRCSACPKPELWQENIEPFNLFVLSITQFRHGFSGPTGLDYGAVAIVAGSVNVDLKTCLGAIQTMEREYLDIVREKQDES